MVALTPGRGKTCRAQMSRSRVFHAYTLAYAEDPKFSAPPHTPVPEDNHGLYPPFPAPIFCDRHRCGRRELPHGVRATRPRRHSADSRDRRTDGVFRRPAHRADRRSRVGPGHRRQHRLRGRELPDGTARRRGRRSEHGGAHPPARLQPADRCPHHRVQTLAQRRGTLGRRVSGRNPALRCRTVHLGRRQRQIPHRRVQHRDRYPHHGVLPRGQHHRRVDRRHEQHRLHRRQLHGHRQHPPIKGRRRHGRNRSGPALCPRDRQRAGAGHRHRPGRIQGRHRWKLPHCQRIGQPRIRPRRRERRQRGVPHLERERDRPERRPGCIRLQPRLRRRQRLRHRLPLRRRRHPRGHLPRRLGEWRHRLGRRLPRRHLLGCARSGRHLHGQPRPLLRQRRRIPADGALDGPARDGLVEVALRRSQHPRPVRLSELHRRSHPQASQLVARHQHRHLHRHGPGCLGRGGQRQVRPLRRRVHHRQRQAPAGPGPVRHLRHRAEQRRAPPLRCRLRPVCRVPRLRHRETRVARQLRPRQPVPHL